MKTAQFERCLCNYSQDEDKPQQIASHDTIIGCKKPKQRNPAQ